jgi:hypothetical protein
MEMSYKKTKVDCRLITRGTKGANAKVIDDLVIPDPEPAIGKKTIKKLVEKETEDDSQSKTS